MEKMGKYKEVDYIMKKILATNNFLLTKKKRNPQQEMIDQLNMVNARISDLEENVNTMDLGSEPTEIILDNKEVKFKNDN